MHLPHKPSRLIYLALADLAAIEADPRYRVRMNVCHQPLNGLCIVNLAGAVIARSLGFDPSEYVVPGDLGRCPALKLRAINSLSTGKVRIALGYLHLRNRRDVDETDVTSYVKDPGQFRADMLSLAAAFASVRR